MTNGEKTAIQEIAGSTKNIVDRYRNLILYRAYNRNPEVLRIILDKRNRWLNWLSVTQRQWQSKASPNPKRNKHWDSHIIREKYVRCTA